MKYSRAVLALAAFACLSTSSLAQQQRPDIFGLWTRGGAANTLFRPPPSGTGPVMTLPGQNVPRQAGNYNSPILQPWAKEVVRKQTELVLAQDRALNTPQEMCWPMGVPHILQLNFHAFIIDDGKKITFLYERHNQRRTARLNASHPANVKTSWFGDSVAHWEGDTLVVDTVGLDPRTWVDVFATPHTDKLHVVERYRLRDANTLDVTIEVDDPGTFTTKWSAMVTYTKDDDPWLETICSENNIDAATGKLYDQPMADKPDF